MDFTVTYYGHCLLYKDMETMTREFPYGNIKNEEIKLNVNTLARVYCNQDLQGRDLIGSL